MKVVSLLGGLGNQMFQYTFSLALKEFFREEEIYYNIEFYKEHAEIHHGLGLEHIFKIPIVSREISQKKLHDIYQEELHIWRKIKKKILGSCQKHQSRIFQNQSLYLPWVFDIKHNVHYIGHWQHERYFPKDNTLIYDAFKFPKSSDKKILQLLDNISNTKSVAIHVRRGDYCDSEHSAKLGFLSSSNYYQNAIQYIQEKESDVEFYVFSDDPKWCAQYQIFNNLKNIHIIDFLDTQDNYFYTMQALSLSLYTIIANSTFSWWGAWLNTRAGSTILSPNMWTNTQSANDIQIFPARWHQINIL